MGGTPDMLFVIDTNKEDLAILEARKLGIPVIAVLDTNSSPDGIDYPIPGNDDAARAIALYCDLIARAALDGMAAQLGSAGVDIGALEEAPVEEAGRGRGRAPRADPGAARQATSTDIEASGGATMSITAAMVKELREVSGAGMMDAKRALTETGGDMEAAIDWLRTKGLAKAAKKSGRTAAEGLVGVAVKGGVGVAVEVNSETDFVARNSDFQAIVRAIAEVATGCADLEAAAGRAARRQDRRRRR